jgi:hypothetical protein
MRFGPTSDEEPVARRLLRADPLFARAACLTAEGAAWSVENIDGACPISDGSHEQLVIDYSTSTISVMATAAEENKREKKYLGNGRMLYGEYPTADDGKRIWLCHLNPALKEIFERNHNICVSAFASTHVSGSSVFGALLNAPFAATGVKVYQVVLNTDAILAAARSSGAIDRGDLATKAIVKGKIDAATTSKDLGLIATTGQRFILSDVELAAAVTSRMALLTATEARQAQEAQIERDRQRQLAQEDAAKAAASEAVAQQAAAEARKVEIERNKAVTAAFRKSVKLGTLSHCGLVIEVRGPVAIVQTMIGKVGLRIDQLYPADLATCQFVNGLYEDPHLPY